MMPRLLSSWALALSVSAPVATTTIVACSSPGSQATPNAEDAGRTSFDADAVGDASDGGERETPPAYDFTVKCEAASCATQLAARGGRHACAILQDRSVRCWGSNASGQLGTGVADGGSMATFEAGPRRVLGVSNATGVSAVGRGSAGTTCVVSGPGDVDCFGDDAFGQLGLATSPSSGAHPAPARIEGLRAKSASLAGTFALALGTDDRVWSWGRNDALQLARSDEAPDAGSATAPALADRLLRPVRAYVGTFENGFVATDEGEVLSWGASGSDAPLGRVSSWDANPTPATVGLSDVTSLAAGAAHVCALARGDVYCWGDNDDGQLGTGDRGVHATPVRTLLPSGMHAVAVAAGGRTTCAIDWDGAVHCWGANDKGQLGVDPGFGRTLPRRIEGLNHEALAVVLMDGAACALLRDGAVSCWGDNVAGELGRGRRDGEIHLEPAPVVFE